MAGEERGDTRFKVIDRRHRTENSRPPTISESHEAGLNSSGTQGIGGLLALPSWLRKKQPRPQPRNV